MRAKRLPAPELPEFEPPSVQEVTRKERWEQFDNIIKRSEDAAPAFLQEITVGGLWSIQKKTRQPVTFFSEEYRLKNNPPDTLSHGECYYDVWPGDHRGWMRFKTKEEAQTFYKFAEGIMSFEDYQKIPHDPASSVRIYMDENGDFIEKKEPQE